MINLKEFFIKRLLFQKIVTIDHPGFILTKTTIKISNKQITRRLVYLFEDIIVELQDNSVSEFGIEKTKDLWKKIGTEFGKEYINTTKLEPVPRFFAKDAIHYIFQVLASSGGSCVSTVEIADDLSWIRTSGKNNIICRKTTIPDFHMGVGNIILEGIIGSPFKSKKLCHHCSDNCTILFERTDKLTPIRNINGYKYCPCWEHKSYSNSPKHSNFRDFVRFKKIKVDEDGKLVLFNKYIFPFSPEGLEIIYNEYKIRECENILFKSLKKSIKGIAKTVFDKEVNTKKRLKILEEIFSVLGYGILDYYQYDDKIRCNVYLPLERDIKKMTFYVLFIELFTQEAVRKELFSEYKKLNEDILILEFSKSLEKSTRL